MIQSLEVPRVLGRAEDVCVVESARKALECSDRNNPPWSDTPESTQSVGDSKGGHVEDTYVANSIVKALEWSGRNNSPMFGTQGEYTRYLPSENNDDHPREVETS